LIRDAIGGQLKERRDSSRLCKAVGGLDYIMINAHKSFLLAFLRIFFALSSWSFFGSFFFLRLLLSLQSSLLLFHDLLVLLNGLGVHLDSSVAETAVISIPVLCHEGSRTA